MLLWWTHTVQSHPESCRILESIRHRSTFLSVHRVHGECYSCAVIYLTAVHMLSHSVLSGAEGAVMDICKTTYEVTGDECRALITIQQAGVTLDQHVFTISG